MFGDLSAREGTDAVGDGLRRSNIPEVYHPSEPLHREQITMRDSHVPEDFAAMQPAYTGESIVCFIASGGIYLSEKGIQICFALVAKRVGRGAGMNIAAYTAKRMKTVPDGRRLREDVHQGRYLRS
ncbi:MAG: hypothetical protein OHK93_002683 [Ramalina farinacea]|uniref:Uncharacterized protein n=1 Tax=Ramalina farinacea TaxID=258253 RepID=A0AA43TXG4_9LECA|nr:hypothetical protein [Ramalina farinacea]